MSSILYIGGQPAWSDGLNGKGYAFRFTTEPPDPLSLREDLVFLDLGLDLSTSFLANWDGRIPLLVIHESGQRQGALAAVRAGACDYLLKPFAPSELLAAIDEALSRPQRLARATQDLLSLAENQARTSAHPKPLPRASAARQIALQNFYLLLRAQVLPKASSLQLWERLMKLERVYLHGLFHSLADDPAFYLLLNLDILATYSDPRLYPLRAGEAVRRFLDRVEQREIEEPLFLLAAALRLCSDHLPIAFRSRYAQCWRD